MRSLVVNFVTASNHPEGDAWFSVIESNLAAAHQNLTAVIEALKDCRFERALPHSKLANALIYNCRWIGEFTLGTRRMYLPDVYLAFMGETNDTLTRLGGYLSLLVAQIEEKK